MSERYSRVTYREEDVFAIHSTTAAARIPSNGANGQTQQAN